MVDSCVICCLNYNLSTRRPWDLGCGHCVCEQCYKTSKLTVCVECRQPANNPHLQYTLLRLLQPGSPTSFPIGLVAADVQEDAPGTPRPSAPVVEVEPWEPESDSDSFRRTGSNCSSASGSLGVNNCNTMQQPQPRLQHRLSQQSRCNGTHSRSPESASPSAPPIAPSSCAVPGRLTVLGDQLPASTGQSPLGTAQDIPVHALEFSSTWAAADGTVTLGVGYTTTAATSIVSHQAFLTSFPVEDFDLLDCLPESPTSSRALAGEDEHPQAETAAQERPAVNTALSVVQETMRCCATLLQPLLVPHVLFAQGPRQGWPAPGPSLILAATSSSWRTWSAYSNAMQHTLAHCSTWQLDLISKLGCLLQSIGLSFSGQLAAYMLATWVLGALLYHWGLGLQLLPVVAAALGLMSFASMHSSSNGCSLWPAKLAGTLMTGYCLAVGLLALIQHTTGLCVTLHSRLLAATPQALLFALLLMWGQVVVEIVSMGWANYKELKFASLVARCWCVAAVCVLLGGGSATLDVALATIPWVQKGHLLLETPVFVHHLGMLWGGGSNSCRRPGQAAAAAMRQDGATSSSGSSAVNRHVPTSLRSPDSIRRTGLGREDFCGAASTTNNGAWLFCLHVLLQLSLMLFVPPAPLAAAEFLPSFVCAMCVWAARVLLCGCVMQLALSAISLDAAVGPGHLDGPRVGSDIQLVGNSACAGGAGSITWLGSAQCEPGLCSPRADDCRPSSSCSGSAVNCMALTARSRSPLGAHGCQLLAHGDHCGSHNVSRNSLSAAMPAGINSQGAGIFTGAMGILWQHLVYFVLLCIAAVGDTFIMAAPSAASLADVRAAWHMCVQNMLVLLFVGECAMALWSEFKLLRYQHFVVVAGLQRQEVGYNHNSAGACTA